MPEFVAECTFPSQYHGESDSNVTSAACEVLKSLQSFLTHLLYRSCLVQHTFSPDLVFYATATRCHALESFDTIISMIGIMMLF